MKIGKSCARILGTGYRCLGVVMKAYEMDVITMNESISSIQELVKAGLWISPEVLGEVLTSLED